MASSAALLTVNPSPVAPWFVSQPVARRVPEGSPVRFSVVADGHPVPGYQWQVSLDDGESFTNITDASFGGAILRGTLTADLDVLSVVSFLDGALFRAQATNSEGYALSAPALLSIGEASTLEAWLEWAGVLADRRGPEDRNGPLLLTNLEAYAMGLPPMGAAPGDLPRMERTDGTAGIILFHYTRNTSAEGVSLSIIQSADLSGWQPAVPESDSVISEEDGVERRRAVFWVEPGVPLFLRLEVIAD